MPDLDKARKYDARWRLLVVLDAGRLMPTSETLLLSCLNGIDLDLTPNEVRRELVYLEKRELLTIKRGQVWTAELTRLGIDMVEYTVPCDPGINRPEKWT